MRRLCRRSGPIRLCRWKRHLPTGYLTVLREISASLSSGARVSLTVRRVPETSRCWRMRRNHPIGLIIEEAGKAHGFDLALPLQAGHRWLLIGDHKQLPPYRFKDYREGIDSLETAVNALDALPQGAGGLLDIEWIQSWKDREEEQQEEFKEYARRWLNSFERVFEYCSVATGLEKRTLDQADGAAAGKLSHQHRMHPTIGDLISGAYLQMAIW